MERIGLIDVDGHNFPSLAKRTYHKKVAALGKHEGGV